MDARDQWKSARRGRRALSFRLGLTGPSAPLGVVLFKIMLKRLLSTATIRTLGTPHKRMAAQLRTLCGVGRISSFLGDQPHFPSLSQYGRIQLGFLLQTSVFIAVKWKGSGLKSQLKSQSSHTRSFLLQRHTYKYCINHHR